MKFFGKKKNKVSNSTVSASSKVSNPTDPQNTIVTLRQSIVAQDKRTSYEKNRSGNRRGEEKDGEGW